MTRWITELCKGIREVGTTMTFFTIAHWIYTDRKFAITKFTRNMFSFSYILLGVSSSIFISGQYYLLKKIISNNK